MQVRTRLGHQDHDGHLSRHSDIKSVANATAQWRRNDFAALRQLGNQAVQRRAKAYVSTSDDPCEREADRNADQISTSSSVSASTTDAPLRHVTSGSGVMLGRFPTSVQQALATPGQPLDSTIRTEMERHFGYDFSPVRIHTDGPAARSARLLGADAYTVGADIAFAAGACEPTTRAGRGLIAHELTHVVQQAVRPVEAVQRRGSNDAQLANIQGLTMPDLLTCLDSMPREVLVDEEAGQEVGGNRLVVAMRAVRARREADIVSFAQTNRDLLQRIPADQSADILRFVAMPREQDAENVNFALEVSVPIVKTSGLRLRGESTGEQALDDGGSAEPISDFEGRILRDRSLIVGAVLDPESRDIVGYQVPGGTGLRRIVDRGGAIAFQSEIGLDTPLLDPWDFIPGPGTVAKMAAGAGTKAVGKVAVTTATAKGVKAASTLPLGAILKLRRVSKALSKTALKASAPKAAVINFTRKFSKADEAAIAAARKAYFVDREIATIAGTAGHEAAGALPRGIDFARDGFQQELKLHFVPWITQRWLDEAAAQSLRYTAEYQAKTAATATGQLVPIRSVKHIWISPTDAVMAVIH
jgi:Domain of unknown function (DUF4157)